LKPNCASTESPHAKTHGRQGFIAHKTENGRGGIDFDLVDLAFVEAKPALDAFMN
jgi:hypothetical protein